MLEQNTNAVSENADAVTKLWDELDQDRNGSLSKSELKSGQDSLSKNGHDLSTKYFLDNFEDIAKLEDGWFDSDKELEKDDVKMLGTLASQTNLDAKYFIGAKDFLSQNDTVLDRDGNGLVSIKELNTYTSTFDVSRKDRASIAYLKTRISGQYSNQSKDHQDETEKDCGCANSSYFEGEIDINQFNNMSLEDRVAQTQKDIVSKSFITDWEENTEILGKVVGVGIAGVVGPASGPGAVGAVAVGFFAGGFIGSRIGRFIGKHRGQNYYENTQQSRINRLFS